MSKEHGWVPEEKAVAKNGVRVIKLIHFVSGNVVNCGDDGCDERGSPNQQRQHLINILRKRLRVGKEEVPTFRLAAEPGDWPPARNDKEAAARARDIFDRDLLKDDRGRWRMPDAEWLELSRACQAADKERNSELKRQAKSERAMKGLALLEKLASGVIADRADDDADGKKPKKGAATA